MNITFNNETYKGLLDEANKQDKPMARLINEILVDYVNNKNHSERDSEREQTNQ
ncbi:hypothetical protein [Serratia odorifera]|uniref:hypothetical protein n=1 Tax=Serratia odorifera TaxID=618 RepID=UPI0023605502|nr:hypothetical protein [Serratia odorifera]